jgi:hypothetical protein
MGAALAIFAALAAHRAQGEPAEASPPTQGTPQDLATCPGSAPEPAQSAAWSVAFCNRTGHDVVIEFHDNDCPAQDWSRRGDVYQRLLHKGESQKFPLCYADEPAGKKLAPGVPTLRIPGGKGVVTTWAIVGDCGERSRPLNLDARTFYDRGEYKTGIVLLQHPAGAAHCAAEVAAQATAPPPAAVAPSSAMTPHSPIAPPATPPAAPPAAVLPAAVPAVAAPPPVNNRGSGTPTLTAAIDAKDAVARTVRVFAKDGLGYKCSFNLGLTFTDGGSWNDHGTADIAAGDVDAPIATRKYLKSVSKVQLTSSKCTPP